ncbi:SDR family NAD(P)-dependent oxidoreductase [Paenisporosarcina quisquiliarum]|uniref:SDR family NAD(P)-dependent oxidoreductase n=1 Tax=Paenisporosarcina quisquiliarum TaxID=365346 RepID=UPI00373608A7
MYTYTLLERFLFTPTYVNKAKLLAELNGKTVLITGASSGIGEQLAYDLADANCHLILVARREKKLVTMKKEIEKSVAKVSVYHADLRNAEQLNGLLSFLLHIPDGVDMVVSNAGLSIKRSIQDSLERSHDFNRTMAINYFAPVQLLLSLIPALKKNQGHIINVSTVNALLTPVPFWAAYQASKSAFDVWFRSAEPELNVMGISTTSIYLPLVKTPMIEPTAAYKKAPAMSSNHVAQIISKSFYTKRKRYQPWWLIFGQIGSLFFRSGFGFFVTQNLRKRGNYHEDH